MNATKIKPFALPAILVLAAGVFVMDLLTPRGYVDWVWYFLLMLFSAYVSGRYIHFLLAVTFSALMLVGYYFSPPGIDYHIAYAGRLAGLTVLWIMALILYQLNRAEAERARAFQQLAETNETLAALTKVTTNAVSTLELKDLLMVLLQRLVEVMQADAATISLRENEHLVVRASVGIEAAVEAKYSVPIGQGFAGTIAQTLKPLYIADAQTDERVERPFLKQGGIRSLLGVPMRRNGTLVGVIHMGWRSPHPQQERDLHLLEITAERSASAILNAQLYEKSKLSEARYRSLFQNLLEGFAYCRMVFEDDQPRDFIYLEVNYAFENLTGLKNVVGKKVTELIPGIRESNPEMFEIYARVVLTGQPEKFETYVEALGVWFSISVYSPGKEHFVAVFDNITERKRASERVRESEERYRALVEESSDVIGIYQEGKLVFLNSAGMRKLGARTKEELLGRKSESLIHPEDFQAATDRVRRRLAGDTDIYPSEVRYLRMDGTVLPMEVSASPVTFGGKSGVQFIARDITARKLAEAQLHDSEALYHSLVENLPQHVFRKDLAGCFTFANPRFCKSLGKPLAEILGKTDYDFFPAELAAKYQRDDQEVTRTGQSFEGEEENLKADGETVFVNVVKTPLRDADGKIIGLQGISWDITERKRTDEALRASRQILEGIMNAIPVRVFWKDGNLVYLGCNAAFARDAGLADPKDIIGKDDFQLAWRDRAELYRGDDRQVIQSGCSKLFIEEPLTTPEGTTLTLLTSKIPLRSCAGKITGVLGTYMDVTERKRAQRLIMDALNYNQTMLEHSPVGIISYTAEGDTVAANPAAARILGATVEQLKSQNFRNIDSWQQSGLRAVAERCLQTGQEQSLEAHLATSFGKQVWLSCQFVPFSHEGQPQLMLMFADVTEDRRAKDQLRLQSSALTAAANAIVITDGEGVIEWANDAFTTFTGYAVAEALGKKPGQLLKSGKHDEAFYRNMWNTILAGKVWRGEMVNRRKDGSLYNEDMTITPMINEAGAITHFIAVMQNVTERMVLEGQLRQAQKMEAIGQLAGGVAHDFNNMLAVIRGNAELLLMDDDEFSTRTSDGLKQITAAADRAANLTRQLLAFSRKQVMQFQPADVNDVVTNLTKMLNRIIGEQIELQCNYAQKLPFVQADVGMLEQVLVNLAVNARDAMPKGGQLSIRTEKLQLLENEAPEHPEARAGEFVCLSVGDTGTGIAPEHLAHIFEPFFTTKEVGKGTGLGLATVYGIVKQHSGWVEVTSQVGGGTTFKILLPAIPPTAAATAPAPELALRGGTERILVVEDEEAVRAMARRILESFGYRVEEAASGREALELWQTRGAEIDLLLTDMVMPGSVMGRELAEQLQAQKPALKVIFISGYSAAMAGKDTDFIRRTKSYYLQKPCPTRLLIRTVRECLDEKQPMRVLAKVASR